MGGLRLWRGLLVTLLATLVILASGQAALWMLDRVVEDRWAGAIRGEDIPLWAQPDSGAYYAVSILLCGGTEMLVLAVWILWGQAGQWGDVLALSKVRLRNLLGWTMMALGFAVACDLMTGWLGRPIVPEIMIEAYQSAGCVPLIWLALVGMAPLAEEAVFRGFLFTGVEASPLGRWGAVGLSTALWAAMHRQYDGWTLSIVVLSGVLLGLARARSGSIVVTWAMHAALNTVATFEAMIAAA